MNKELSQRISAAIQEFSSPIHLSRTMRPTEYTLDGVVYPVQDASWQVHDIFEVPNLNDEWILAQENAEEIDRVLEGRIKGHEQHFVKPQESALASAYEITEPMRPNTARMMAYTVLSDEYHQLTISQQREIERLNTEREQKRQQINDLVRNKQISKGLGEKRRQEAEQEFKRKTAPFVQQSNEYRQIHDLISRKFIFEQFSDRIPTDEFQLRPESLHSVVRDIDAKPGIASIFQGFISRTSNYLLNGNDQYLINNYSYKSRPGLTKRIEDTTVLGLAQELALDKQGVSPTIAEPLKKLGESYISFLGQQALDKSKRQGALTDSFPILHTLYDVLNSTMTLSQYSTYRESLGALLERTMGGVLKSQYVKMECERLTKRYIEEAQYINNRYSGIIPRLSRTKFANVPQELKEYVVSDVKRLFDGTKNALSLLFSVGSRKGPFVMSPAIEAVHQSITAAINRNKSAFDRARITESNLISLNNSNIYPQLGVTVDLVNNLATYRSLEITSNRVEELLKNPNLTLEQRLSMEAYVREKQPQKGSFAQRAKEIKEATTQLIESGIFPPDAASRENYLREYSLFHISTPYEKRPLEQIEQLNDETRELWFHLLNTSKWFVSPRGDRFLAEHDPELRDNEIDSITYKVDPMFPREHKVELQLAGMDGPIEFWMDTRERLLNRDHQPLTTDALFKLGLTNLLIKRLNFITSGILASSPKRREYEYSGLEGPNFTYRRANYHVLVNDRFTMTSAGVNTHAEEIYSEYGINIFDERDRRRRLGVIGPNDHLTFNRESTPDVMPPEPRPNIVIYKPELLAAYLNRNRNAVME